VDRKLNHPSQLLRTYQCPLPGPESDLNGSCIAQTPVGTAAARAPNSFHQGYGKGTAVHSFE
jgi:hypothetical protein